MTFLSKMKRPGAMLAGIFSLALASVVLLCGAGAVPIENFSPQGAMQADLNAGGHNLTNIATVSATNVVVSGSLSAPNLGSAATNAASAFAPASGSANYAPASGSANYQATLAYNTAKDIETYAPPASSVLMVWGDSLASYYETTSTACWEYYESLLFPQMDIYSFAISGTTSGPTSSQYQSGLALLASTTGQNYTKWSNGTVTTGNATYASIIAGYSGAKFGIAAYGANDCRGVNGMTTTTYASSMQSIYASLHALGLTVIGTTITPNGYFNSQVAQFNAFIRQDGPPYVATGTSTWDFVADVGGAGGLPNCWNAALYVQDSPPIHLTPAGHQVYANQLYRAITTKNYGTTEPLPQAIVYNPTDKSVYLGTSGASSGVGLYINTSNTWTAEPTGLTVQGYGSDTILNLMLSGGGSALNVSNTGFVTMADGLQASGYIVFNSGYTLNNGSIIIGSAGYDFQHYAESLSSSGTIQPGFTIFTGSSSGTATLYTGPNNKGLWFGVKNLASQPWTISYSGGNHLVPVRSTTPVSSVTLASGASTEFYADGSNWDQIDGSGAYETLAATGSVTPGFVTLTGTATTQTLTLPSPATAGAETVIKNQSSQAWTISSASGSQIVPSGTASTGTSTISLSSGALTRLLSDGTSWNQQ